VPTGKNLGWVVVMRNLGELSRHTLHGNVVNLSNGSFLAAGSGHFHTLWTRDFCFSVSGLLNCGLGPVARDHLSLILRNLRPDGLVPRVIDSMSTRVRVVLGCMLGVYRPLTDHLKPEYVDEHGTEAADSNALVLLAAHEVDRMYPGFWQANQRELDLVWQYYKSCFAEGVFVQTKFSDWQDSTQREGVSSYLHLLLWRAAGICGQNTQDVGDLPMKFAHTLRSQLFDEQRGMFFSLAGHAQWGADATLLALYWDFFPASEALAVYKKFRASPLWRDSPLQLPGIPTFPEYPRQTKSFAVRFANTHGYHDQFYWSWLMGLAIRVANKLGDVDEAQNIQRKLAELHQNSRGIEEVFDPSGAPVKTWIYRSECPFSWGAAWCLPVAQ
jgi:hypothetical protein